MKYSLSKITFAPRSNSNGTGLRGQRQIVKTFKSSEAMHEFLNKQDNNDWRESKEDLKAGTYAFAGGRWHNVKNLDASALAHI